jgi:hypothetical protein
LAICCCSPSASIAEHVLGAAQQLVVAQLADPRVVLAGAQRDDDERLLDDHAEQAPDLRQQLADRRLRVGCA